FASRRRHTRFSRDWSSDVCSSDLHVARVTIDRPAVLNAVDGPTHERLCEIWDRIEADPDVRAVVLTGAGERAFCVGAGMSAAARAEERRVGKESRTRGAHAAPDSP